MYCNKCGNEIKEGQNFCTNCGAPVESLNQPVKVKKNKYVLPLCISLIAVVSVVGSFFVARNFYAFMGSRMRPAQIEHTQKAETEDNKGSYTNIHENGAEEAETVDDSNYKAEDYSGPYNYFFDEWVVPVEGAFVSKSGYVNTKYLGENILVAQTTDLRRALILTEKGFKYVNKDALDKELPKETQCADLAVRGSNMFYVLPTDIKDNVEVGELYIIDSDNGKSKLIAKDVVISSPVISPSGKYVAYSGYNSEDKMEMYLGGDGVEAKEVIEGLCYPICVSDSGKMFFTKVSESGVFAYNSEECYQIIKCNEVKNCFINTHCEELVAGADNGTFYYNFDLEGATQISEAPLAGVFTDALNQPYGQIADTTFCDVESLNEVLFISNSGSTFAIADGGKGITTLKRAFNDLTNVAVYNSAGKRTVLYSCDGKLFRVNLDEGDAQETILSGDIVVDSFVCSYDLKKIWLISGGNIFYVENGETKHVASGIGSNIDPLGTGIAWNIEDGWLYYVKGGSLYRVNNTGESEHVVAEDAEILTNIYGKLYYLPASRSCVYLFMNGKFEEVI